MDKICPHCQRLHPEVFSLLGSGMPFGWLPCCGTLLFVTTAGNVPLVPENKNGRPTINDFERCLTKAAPRERLEQIHKDMIEKKRDPFAKLDY